MVHHDHKFCYTGSKARHIQLEIMLSTQPDINTFHIFYFKKKNLK